MTASDVLRRGPVLLRADNFTPPARTPWGGTVIGRRFKGAVAPHAAGRIIGESWEFSCDGTFPSTLVEGPGTLASLVASDPEAVLSSAAVARGAQAIEILVKIVDAGAPLSLQVHPRDDDLSLLPGECGKPESWLVLDAAPGAGIFLGFSRPLSRPELKQALTAGVGVKELLHFAPVSPGDFFEIAPGVPHAIGAGVTLLEPQRVVPGRSGKTLRLWDWGRRYDAGGRLDPQGQARELHIEQGLALIDPAWQVGPAFEATVRRTPRLVEAPGLKARVYPANDYAQTLLFSLAEGRDLTLAVKDGYAALLVLAGTIEGGGRRLQAGQPALWPHAAMPARLRAASDAEFAVIIPASSAVSF